MRIDYGQNSGFNTGAMHRVSAGSSKFKSELAINQVAAEKETLSTFRGKTRAVSHEDIIKDIEDARSFVDATTDLVNQSLDMAIRAQANLMPERVLDLLG